MMMHVKTEANGRVCAVSGQYLGDGDQLVTWPDGVSLDDHRDYKVVDGVPVHDPEPEPEVIPTPMEQLQAEVTDLTLALAELIGTGFGAENATIGGDAGDAHTTT